MSGHTVLVVEDNPITRKMVRVALESEGFRVVEAGDGRSALAAAATERPDLIVLDYVLPDTDGVQLLDELRRQPGAADIPALVVTGMVSRIGDLRTRESRLTHFLPKPIEPSRLIAVVHAHLTAPAGQGGGRTILVVDDEPLNLKLAVLRLSNEGYEVATAPGGAEALELARANPPDAILAHVGMPTMDGFALCREIRRDPRLTATPVVLFSSAKLEEADRELARQMGASALVARTADLREAGAALAESLHSAAPPPLPAGDDELAALHRQRVQAQRLRQTAQSKALLRQAGIQATALALMRSLSEVLGQPANVPAFIGDVLVQFLDAAGLSTGLLYLVEPGDRYRLQAQSGMPPESRRDAEDCFRHPEIIRAVIDSGRPTALAAADPRTDTATLDFLVCLGKTSALAVPFVVLGKTYGVLVLASDHQDFAESSWLSFAGSLAVQFGQTVALGQSLNRLAASEERYRSLMEQANDAILVLDAKDRILEVNRAALSLLGRSRQDMVGRHHDDFVAPEELDQSAAAREQLLREGTVRVQIRHFLRADGLRVPVEVSGSLVRLGEETTILAILHDLTERRRLEAQFLQAQKMESVGRLAGGVAHDFNNLLTLILGYGNLLLHSLADRPAQSQQVESILRAGESAAALTRQLLAFSRRQVLVPTVVDLNALVGQLDHMLRLLIGEDIAFVTRLDPRLGRVRADAGQLEQVIMNLVANARDAMPDGGTITLSTRDEPEPPAALAGAGGTAGAGEAAAHVVLEIADTGTGMDSAVLSHIFEPFFTTKAEGKGTGLGLATVYGIVHQSGGRIEVASQPGEGTTFAVYLPRTDQPVPAVRPAASPPGRGHETVLIAEDEAQIRSLARAVLEEQGYLVLEAAGADEALRLADQHAGPIHLLLTDVVMRGKTGIELGEALSARRPGLKVIYMSGYSDRAVPADAPGVAFLQKPFDPDRLARQVRATLDQR